MSASIIPQLVRKDFLTMRNSQMRFQFLVEQFFLFEIIFLELILNKLEKDHEHFELKLPSHLIVPIFNFFSQSVYHCLAFNR